MKQLTRQQHRSQKVTIIRVRSGVVWKSLSSSIVFEYYKLEVYIQGFGHERLYLSQEVLFNFTTHATCASEAIVCQYLSLMM